jgi:dolichol kinase
MVTVGHSLAHDSRDVALELHALLRDLDPARFSDALRQHLSARIGAVRDSFAALRERVAAVASQTNVSAILDPLDRLVALLGEAPTATDARATWMAFRRRLQSDYEGLAASLAIYDVHVPSLRPTNYVRNVFHVANAVWVLFLVEEVLAARGWLLPVAIGGAVWAWSIEIGRRASPAVNRFLMAVFSPVAHPHEAHRVNSATWYATAFILLAVFFPVPIGVTALAVLGAGDPAAAIIGRRFGRHRLANGRSIEGSAAFVGFGAAAGWLALAIWHPEIAPAARVGLALSAATAGAVAELLTRRIDDNLAIPVAGAAGAQIMAWILG